MKILFYNVENLFDTLDDPFVNDQAFLPDSVLKWDEKRYLLKLQRLAKVIRSVEEPMPMAIGLAEVENRKVLEDLIAALELSEKEIGIIHEESPDERGIDVGFLYRRGPIQGTEHKTYPVIFSNDPGDKTRDILHVKSVLKSGEILHFFINHWPSRKDGVNITLPKRMQAASVLQHHIEEVFKEEKDPKILVMGDFNAGPESPAIKNILDRDRSPNGLLHNLSWNAHKSGLGSLNYRGKWLLFDQILASPSLLDEQEDCRIIPDSFSIFKKDWMLFYNQKYHDFRPNKTYGGRKYHAGFSDHLPVYISLIMGTSKTNRKPLQLF